MSKFRNEFNRIDLSLAKAINDISFSRRGMIKLLSAGAVMGSGLMGFPSPGLADETPRRGGKLRAAMSNASAADTLDPAKANNSADYSRIYMFYNGLTELDEKMTPQMALAESVESGDGLTWEIKLRPGVTFHDGKSLTAEDVIYSLNRHKDPAVASSVISLAKQLTTITAAGPNEVRIVLAQPNYDVPAILAMPPFMILRNGTAGFTTANGTGPYTCKEFSPGIRSVGARNPNYWKAGLPYLDEVELLGITDHDARVNALMSGDLHMVSSLMPRDVTRLQATGRFSALETRSGMYTDLIVRTDRAPGNNEDFVLAMKYLQPREKLLKMAMQGHGDIANDTPVPPWHPMFNAELPQRPFDPDKARYHITKAGMAGFKGEIVNTPGLDGSTEGSQMLQQLGRQAGLDLSIRLVPRDGYWSTHWMKHPIGYGAINPRPTLDIMFSQFYSADASMNESGWKNAQFEQLLVAARGEREQGKRKQIYGDMQKLIYDHNGVVIPLFISALDGYSNQVKGVEPHTSGLMMGYRFHEKVWLA